jgi:hypothetical protein
VLPEHPIDLRLWLAGAVDLSEMFWLAVKKLDSALNPCVLGFRIWGLGFKVGGFRVGGFRV